MCASAAIFFTQITGLTHHRTCRPSHLFPRLNFLNLHHSRFFLFVQPFTCPNSFCRILSGQCGKLFFHFQAKSFHEQGQGSRTLFACRSAQFLTSPWEPSPLHGLSNSLPVPYPLVAASCGFHAILLESFFISEKLILHFFLLAISFAPTLVTIVLKSTPVLLLY